MTYLLAPDDHRKFIASLQEVALSCIALVSKGEGLKGSYLESGDPMAMDRAKSFADAADSAQRFLIQYRPLFNSFKNMHRWAEDNSYIADFVEVVGLSLVYDSARVAEIMEWIAVDTESIDRESYFNATRKLLRIHGNFLHGGDPTKKLPAPKFFDQGRFRPAKIFKRCFREEYVETIGSLIELVRESDLNSYSLLKRVEESGSATLKIEFQEALFRRPVAGHEHIRVHFLNAKIPTGDECSLRASNLFAELIDSNISTPKISAEFESIRTNQAYMVKAFPAELSLRLQKACSYFEENDLNDTFQNGVEKSRLLRHLFDISGFGNTQFRELLFSVTAEFSLGKQVDLENLSDAEAFRTVIRHVIDRDNATHNPLDVEQNLRHCIFSAVISGLPMSMLQKVAQGDDHVTVMLYKLTHHQAILKGVRDHTLVEPLMRADLGL